MFIEGLNGLPSALLKKVSNESCIFIYANHNVDSMLYFIIAVHGMKV